MTQTPYSGSRLTMADPYRWWLALALAALMVLSRPYPMTAVVHLADASNAIFFIGGALMLSTGWLPIFIALTILLDTVSIKLFGTSDFCVSRAYVFQWPAFAALWFGGRWLGRGELSPGHMLRMALGFTLLQTLAFGLTSNSFYYLSGRFPEPNFDTMVQRSIIYYPGYLFAGLRYVGVFLIGLQLFGLISKSSRERNVDTF